MANTHSADFERSSSQSLTIADGDQTGLDITGDFSIEFWIKWETDPASATQAVIDKLGGSPLAGYRVEMAGNKLNVLIYNGGTLTEIDDADFFSGVSTGEWHHVAVTLDTSALSNSVFYLDGSSTGAVNVSGTNQAPNGSTVEFSIGKTSFNTDYADGRIDDVRIWSDIRTGTEISDNYNTELNGDEAGLVGYWKLNNSLLDETSNNNDLTNNNTVTFVEDPAFGGTDYPLTAAVGSFTLTGFAATLTSARNIIASVGSFTLTGIDAALKRGYGIIAEVGAFTLTGIDAILTSVRTMAAAVGSFTLTGIAAAFKKNITLVAEKGTFSLIGWAARFISSAWSHDTKPTDSYTNDTKPSDSWTNDDI